MNSVSTGSTLGAELRARVAANQKEAFDASQRILAEGQNDALTLKVHEDEVVDSFFTQAQEYFLQKLNEGEVMPSITVNTSTNTEVAVVLDIHGRRQVTQLSHAYHADFAAFTAWAKDAGLACNWAYDGKIQGAVLTVQKL